MLADRPHGRQLSAHEQRQIEDLERRLLHGPLAPARPVPAGSALGGRWAALAPLRHAEALLGVALAAVAGLLVLAAVVGGVPGLIATAAALLATLLTCQLLRKWRYRLRRPLLRLPRFRRSRSRPPN